MLVTVLSELKHLRSVDIRVSPSTGLHVLTALTSLVLTCGGAVKTSTFEELKQLTQLAVCWDWFVLNGWHLIALFRNLRYCLICRLAVAMWKTCCQG